MKLHQQPFRTSRTRPRLISDQYDEETSTAFEAVSAPASATRIQLNGAGYYIDVDDMQFFEFFVGQFGLLRVVSNMDEVEIAGSS